jgi:osmoprotectant transport system ATP-binding protein
MIVVDQLTKQFPQGGRPAVDHASFEARPGEFIVLLGPSGCGKTTLLKMINRLYEPTGGRIVLDGVDVLHQPVTELRRRIGYVIQQTGLFPHMRIEANIAVVPRLLGWEQPHIERRINELLDLVGLPREYRSRFPRQLSGGEQQRVGIARALAADPAILLMDEPFGAIDAITRSRLQGELLALQRKLHKTILFVTHDVEEALRLADRIIVMRDGRIVQLDTPLQLLTHPADDFVARLVDAGDILRRLSLLTAGAVASPLDGRLLPETGALRADTDVRTALARLLSTGADVVPVVDEAGRAVGSLSFEDVRRAVAQARD